MSEITLPPDSAINARTEALYRLQRNAIYRRADVLFAFLMLFQWIAGIVTALWLSPRAWSGEQSQIHIHVWAAIFLGGAIAGLPIALAYFCPGRAVTRHVIAVGQTLTSALLIHLTGGRIETHFHVFGSLAFLAFYRDWRVLVTATIVIAGDHLFRGMYWPQSVYGVLSAQPLRTLEHAGWVIFEDVFLFNSIRESLREMRSVAERQSQLEATNAGIEQAIKERTEELTREIAERMRTERILAGQEARVRTIVNSTADGIITIDDHGLIRSFSTAAERIYGYTAEEVVGKAYSLYLPQLNLSFGPRENADIAVNGHSYKVLNEEEITGHRRDGSTVPLAFRLSEAWYEEERLFIVLVQDITERHQAEGRLKTQIERLASLRRIDAAITSSLDRTFSLNFILDETIGQLQVHAANVLLLNPHTQTLNFAVGRGIEIEKFRTFQMRVGEGVAGQVALTRNRTVISDLANSAVEFIRWPLISQEGFVSYIALPLVAKGMVKGVLEVFHRSRLSPDTDWLEFLEHIAGQAAIALDNAELFQGLQQSNFKLSRAYETTLEGWVHALDIRDKETEGHTQRVTEMTVRLANEMGLEDEELVHVRRGALLHDIGKLGIPDSILFKQGPLTPEERVIMQKHTMYAFEWLSPIDFLRRSLDIPYCHHEKWDGTGYPRGLKGEEIPLSARIFAIIDVWDALISDRPYRKGWPKEKVRDHVHKLSGTHFDPNVVEAFLNFDLAGTSRVATVCSASG